MKKIFFLIFCFFTVFGFSQLTLKKLDGTTISNNDVLNFTAITDPESYLGLKIFNSSANDIFVKAQCISISNGDGSGTQLCFGDVCIANISAGNIYPNNPAIIPANGQNGNFDHFLSTTAGANPNEALEYVFKFFQIDASEAEIGNSVTFTYKYSPQLALSSFNSLNDFGVKLKSNVVSSQLDFEVAKNLQSEIFDLNGKLLLSKSLKAGNQVIDVSSLNSGIYFLNVINSEINKTTIKFIKN